MTNKNDIALTYQHFRDLGHLVLCVTLSTAVKSPAVGTSDRMRHMWDSHFIHRIMLRLPLKAQKQVNHDFVVEVSPEGNYHFHGYVAIPSQYRTRIWKDQKLNNQLNRDLMSFRKAGKYRPFCINSFLIEPAENVGAWTSYIYKSQHRTD